LAARNGGCMPGSEWRLVQCPNSIRQGFSCPRTICYKL
jgi:hypothetical protein